MTASSNATIQMYDLAGSDESLRFSPFCWRTRFAIAHKRLALDTIPWRYTDKARIAGHGAERVPVILDRGTAIADSWRIAEYLEDTYPDRPSLFGGSAGRGLARAISNWADLVLHPLVLRMKIGDVFATIHERDRDYFRQSREARFGRTLEQLVADGHAFVEPFHDALDPLRRTLEQQTFLSGQEPLYADYVVCSAFQWISMVSREEVLKEADPLLRWRGEVLRRYEANLRST
jgi:glutathione S-transferase